MDDDDLPPGWTVWNDDPGGQLVLAYRPDEFDGSQHPAACLPTLTVDRGPPDRRRRRAGRDRSGWHVALYLEPDVRVRAADSHHDDRPAAVAAARDVAAAFAAGELDYRDAYQVPAEDYLDRLDALTGGGD